MSQHLPALALLVSLNVSSVLNLLFSFMAARLLDVRDFGTLGPLLNIASLAAIPLIGLQLAVTQAVARGESYDSIYRLLKRMGMVTASCLALATPLLQPLRSYLKMAHVAPVLLSALWIAVVMISVVPQGALLGRRRFGPLAKANILGAASRLVVGFTLMHLNFGVTGAIAASLSGGILTLSVLLFATRDLYDRGVNTSFTTVRYSTSALAILALGGFTTFSLLDQPLARHNLDALQAGYYAAAGTIGRVALYLPSTVLTVSFPYLVEANRSNDKERSRALLVLSLAVVLTLGAVISLLLTVSPGLIIGHLFGLSYEKGARVIIVLSWASTLMGGVGALVYFYQARSRSAASIACWSACATLLVMAPHFHQPLALGVLVLLLSAGLLVILVALLFLPAATRRRWRTVDPKIHESY